GINSPPRFGPRVCDPQRIRNMKSFDFSKNSGLLRLTEPRAVRNEKRWRTTAVQDAGRWPMTLEMREASWSAPVLWRFGQSAGKTGDGWKGAVRARKAGRKHLWAGAWHPGAFQRFNSNGVVAISPRLVRSAYLGCKSENENNLNEVVVPPCVPVFCRGTP